MLTHACAMTQLSRAAPLRHGARAQGQGPGVTMIGRREVLGDGSWTGAPALRKTPIAQRTRKDPASRPRNAPPQEFEICCFSAVSDLLAKTGVRPNKVRARAARDRLHARAGQAWLDLDPGVRRAPSWLPAARPHHTLHADLCLAPRPPLPQIGAVITNCSLFNPTPSLSAAVMNHFGMGSSTINYNLGGMGCSGEPARARYAPASAAATARACCGASARACASLAQPVAPSRRLCSVSPCRNPSQLYQTLVKHWRNPSQTPVKPWSNPGHTLVKRSQPAWWRWTSRARSCRSTPTHTSWWCPTRT